jgi:hypothetical protein
LINAATLEFQQFVAQGGNAGWRQLRLVVQFGKKIAWMRLKSHDAAGHAAVRCFIFQKRKHGLVAAVDAVKITNRQGALGGPVGVVESAKYLHAASVIKKN